MNGIFKKSLSAVLCLLLILSLFGCGKTFSKSGGITEGVQIKRIPSAIYTEEDINAAIDVVLKDFRKNWAGCKLTLICYAGDNVTREEAADTSSAKETIVLTSSFDVDSSGGDGSLNANDTYDNWGWILSREKGGEWQLIDYGY